MSKHVLNTRLISRGAREVVHATIRGRRCAGFGVVRVGSREGAHMVVTRKSAALPRLAGEIGDDEAAEGVSALYAAHSARLVRRLTRQTGCGEAARELAQEAFVRLIRMGPAGLKSVAQPEAYLWRVSTNLLRDWGRRRVSGERTREALAADPPPELDQIAVLESRDTLRRLEQAMARLKPKTRQIFLAHRIEGLTYAEIAERTGLSVKGVEKQMSKAIAKIDRFLDHQRLCD